MDDYEDLLGMEDELVMGGTPGNEAMAVGNPFYDISGAPASPAQAAAQAAAIQAKKIEASRVLSQRPVRSSNLQPIGFVQENVAAGATVNVTTQPQTVFKPLRLVVAATIAPLFVLTDIRVGNVSQLPSATENPCESFIAGGFGIGLSLDTVSPAIDLSLQIRNISQNVATFRATFFGYSMQ